GALKPRVRAALLAIVGASWLWAILRLITFAASMLSPKPGATPPSVADFTKTWGVLIIVATVFVPLAIAAAANLMAKRPDRILTAPDSAAGAGRTVMNHLYSALVDPLAELCRRMGWGVLAAIGFILTYAICYNIWASFAYPFYLEYMHYTKDEVAFASKIFGIIMTMLGISLGGYLFAKIGRFPTILLGAILPPLGNFLYADLADGAPMIDGFAHLLRLDALARLFGSDERMMRLLIAICYENISTGLALTAFVAYVSSIVSKKYGAIQYALLSSLLSLVGTLGRGAVGEAFDMYGYAPVFRWTAATAPGKCRDCAGHRCEGVRGACRKRAARALVGHLIVRGEHFAGQVKRTENQHACIRGDGFQSLPEVVLRLGSHAKAARDFGKVVG